MNVKRWAAFVALLLSVSLIVGCSGAENYAKDHYDLVDVQGKGKGAAKIYSVQGKGVPAVAEELTDQEKPDETSKADNDRMLLVYSDKIINVHKDPDNPDDTLVEIDSIEYAKQNYELSFLEGYLAASLIGSIFGGDWLGDRGGYGGSSYGSGGSTKSTGTDYSGTVGKKKDTDTDKPTTTDRTGTFTTKKSNSSGSGKSSTSTGSGSVNRKNDGSTPSYKVSTKPKTSSRTGSFSSKKSK